MLKALKQGSIRTLFFDFSSYYLLKPIPKLSLMEFNSSLSASDLKELRFKFFADIFPVSPLSVHHALPHCPLLYYHCTFPVGYTTIVEVHQKHTFTLSITG